jgi:8-oxo-dGTP pyrophosphatase MutT (NUDIX family)
MSGPVDRPGPGEPPLTSGPPVAPRQAASIVLLRGADRALDLLMVRRTPAARFMAGVWVFPGGAVAAAEGEGDRAHRAAAVRELAEEAGIAGVDPAALVKLARWITPEELAIRFDTHFFLAEAPAGQRARPDGVEVVDARWLTPQAALDELTLAFPTVKLLEQLSAFPTAHALLDHARTHPVHPVQPRVVGQGEAARIVLPGEPGYG